MTGHDYQRCKCDDCRERQRQYMREYRQRPEVKARHNARARANRWNWESYILRPWRTS